MNKRLTFCVVLIFAILTGTTTLYAQTADDILASAIKYHDPLGKWDTFSGKMQHVTVFGFGHIVNETIELDRTQDFYSSTAYPDFGTVVRGMDGDKVFFTVNGKAPESEEVIQNWSLNDEGIKMFKEQHTCHFGLLMHLKQAGMTLSDTVEQLEFDGRNCYSIAFKGEEDKVINPFYLGKRTLYIDAKTYALRGTYYEHPNYPPSHYYFSREIEINGIKVPHSRVFVREDGEFRFSSTNMPIVE